jgi:hypothetical protein
MQQTAIHLPRDLHAKLRKLGGERGMSEEIRRRLEASFQQEARAAADPKLSELQDQIDRLARVSQLVAGAPWHGDPFAFEAFRAAVMAVLDILRPPGEVVPPKRTGSLPIGDDPQAISRMMVRLVAEKETAFPGGYRLALKFGK